MRALGVDFGRARIGLAIGTSGETALPLPSLAASGTLSKDAQAIVTLALKEEVETVVLGLPLLGGQETKGSAICRRLGTLVSSGGLRVEYVDESYTSHEAEAAMIDDGLKASQRRKASDGEAACLILTRFFDEPGLANQP